MRPLSLSAISLLLVFSSSSETGVEEKTDGERFTQMRVERLPDLNTPRGGHILLFAGGELAVFGGHTDGFVRIPTAEYLSGRAWHEVPMVYPHDGGFSALLEDGTVMLGGGSSDDFGIGQSWGVEVYDPTTHSFRGIGILDRKRAYASAYPLGDGRVLVSGNWYGEDAIGIYTPGSGFSHVKDIASGRVRPRILPAGDDYIVFGGFSNYGNHTDGRVDCLSGDSYTDPLLEEWVPQRDFLQQNNNGKIGQNTFLLLARNREDGSYGILKADDGRFSLLEMEVPLSAEGIDSEKISFSSFLQVDRLSRCVWVNGWGNKGRIYFARVDYDAIFDGGKASVQMYYASRSDGPFTSEVPLLLPDGRFVMAGGIGSHPDPEMGRREDNFITSSEVWMLSLKEDKKAGLPWILLVSGLLLCTASALFAFSFRKRKASASPDQLLSGEEPGPDVQNNLLDQMIGLIEEKELWKKADLRLDDIVRELASNRTYISTLLNNIYGTKFPTLVNGYRIRHAQELLREHPDMLMDDVAEESGFSSRTAFFRNFKAVTGMTPKEWLSQNYSL